MPLFIEYQFSGRGLKPDNSNCWKCLDGNFSISISQTVLCIILCYTQILYFMRYKLHLAGNNQTHGTIKRSSKIRSRPHRSSVAPSSQVKHASNLRSLDHKYFDLSQSHRWLQTSFPVVVPWSPDKVLALVSGTSSPRNLPRSPFSLNGKWRQGRGFRSRGSSPWLWPVSPPLLVCCTCSLEPAGTAPFYS